MAYASEWRVLQRTDELLVQTASEIRSGLLLFLPVMGTFTPRLLDEA
nr:hypothetical protein [Maribrevibacterium harenarium]